VRSSLQRITSSAAGYWLRDRPILTDWFLAVAVGAATVMLALAVSLDEAYAAAGVQRPQRVLDYGLLLGPASLLPLRRIRPVTALVAGGTLQIALWLTALPDFFIATAILLYSAAAHGHQRGRWAAWVLSTVLTVFTLLGVLSGEAPSYAVPIVALYSIAATSLGATAAGRHAYTRAAEARARQAERSKQADQDRAVTDERSRIARELHDVVAHGLSVIVVQAGAAQRILDRDPDGARSALGQIEETGRTALREMRQVLSVVRTDPSESWRPAPGLAGLDDLVADLARTGLDVSLQRSAGDELEPLPATVEMTAYRIVQESLTNVLNHGGRGARAAVEITHGPHSLHLSIVDDGKGAAAADRGGHGLRGMKERVEVFGGEMEAGPRTGGGFAVKVSLPIDGDRVA
jgi:signal transduction histidine kinase